MKIVITTLLLTATLTSIAQKVTLNLAKGLKIVETVSITNSSSFSVQGRDMENAATASFINTYVVDDATAGKQQVTATSDKLKVTASQMGQELAYDSDKKDNDGTVEEMLKPLVGTKNTYTIDAQGNATTEKPVEDKMEITMLTGGIMPKANVSKMYLASLLNQDLKVGLAWQDSTEIKGDNSSKTVNSYTVTAIDGDVVSITNNATNVNSGKAEMNGMELAMSGNTKITERIAMSIKTGLITTIETTRDGTLTASVAGMEIPITSKATIKTSYTAQ